MNRRMHFTCSTAFVTVLALLVSLGTQVLLGAITPVWLFDGPGDSSSGVVLIAGVSSFWRADAIIRALSFGLGSAIACLLARRLSWLLVLLLTGMATIATAFAQFPRPATHEQLMVWSAAAPLASLLLAMALRAWRGAAGDEPEAC
ncbi:hypothetical protein RQP53_10585 [Paucibacter sp. APW11]|uniref:Uncharacterized protein n=1 Tax=Roseateles aquae TaxID=3077235 RepID=A0ABU3PC37_9BURK|nr:hypothetical protein [Paucibacter sp. APW11]MDT8999713.1 hypothetical protein [Paucibacter sp. APW11]